MATKVIMPKQGLQMTEGTIISWLAEEGEAVKQGDPLFEMETDKLTIEINAPVSGTLLKIVREEGDVVPITETIAFIGEPGEDISSLIEEMDETNPVDTKSLEEQNSTSKKTSDINTSRETVEKAAKREESAETEKADEGKFYSSPRARWKAEQHGIKIQNLKGSGPEGLIIERDVITAVNRGFQEKQAPKATSLAKKRAEQSDIDLTGIEGSGPRGKIYRRDVESAVPMKAEQSQSSLRFGAQREDKIIPLTNMRKTISARMRESLDTAAQAVHRIEVDMSETVRMRERLKGADIKVSYNDIVVKAVSAALLEHPRMNSRLTDEGILELGSINIGIAVALEGGLIVPVLRNAEVLGLEGIHSESQRLVELARTGGLAQEDFEGGTFSVSNLGMYELDSFTAIINRPESGILAVGAIKEKPAAVGGELVVRPMCEISLTYDHRVIDGAPAAAFLRHVKRVLENPYLLV